MMKYNISILIFTCLIGVSDLAAQNKALGLIKAMNLTYHNANSYSMEVSLKSFSHDEIILTQKGKVRSNHEQMYASYNGITTLLNRKYFMTIDEINQTIFIKNIKEEDLAQMQKQIDVLQVLDENLTNVNMEYLGIQEGLENIKIHNPIPQYSAAIIGIHPTDKTLRKVVYFIDTSEGDNSLDRIQIDYTKVKISQKFPIDAFSEKKYVNISNESITALKPYQDYHIIDQRKKNTK